MSKIPVKDASDQQRLVATFQRTDGADTVETQAVAVVDPSNGQTIDFATQTTLAAIQTLINNLVGTIGRADDPFVPGSPGQIMLAKRRDSDTTTVADGDLNTLNMDEAGRLKVATQPGSVAAVTGSITAVSQQVAIQTNRISNLSIALVATSLVGHNSIFEVSNDSTTGTDGNWKTVQAVRTDANIIETTTGVLSATPAYAWELNVASYAWFRIRSTAHTSGTASYVLKPGAYATEPVPSSQNPDLIGFSYNVAGVIAINTDLITIDCAKFKSLSIQCLSMGTTGVVTAQWANDPSFTAPITATLLSETGATSTTFNAAVLRNVNVLARYFRLRLTTATTAGTTTINVMASQAVLVPLIATQPVSGTVGVTGDTAAAASADALANPTIKQIGADLMNFNGTTWDRQRGNANVTMGDTGAKTASFAGATQTNFNARGAKILVLLSTVTGTTPTLTAQLQVSPDGGTTWLNYGPASTAVTATGNTILFDVYPTNETVAGATPAALTTGATQTVQINGVLPRTWRLNYTIGGTTPSFTFTNAYAAYTN